MLYNPNSPIVQNMINTGQFGTCQPNGYNPYQQNIISTANNYNFSPVVDYQQQEQVLGYSPYCNNVYINGQNYYSQLNSNGYGYNYNQPYNYNYNQPYGYNNNYYSNGYGYYNTRNRNTAESIMLQMEKTKAKIVGQYFGNNYTDAELDVRFNPKNPANIISDEERMINNEYQQMKSLYQLVQSPPLETNAMRTARCIADMSNNFHAAFDNMSMCDFLENELWKLQRENWIRNNVNKNACRDLSTTYVPKDYNELLAMHNSSNPYIGQLLDTSRFDNNLDDMEIGMIDAFRSKRMSEPIKVPSFISSPENQKRRAEFMNEVFKNVEKKRSGGNINV